MAKKLTDYFYDEIEGKLAKIEQLAVEMNTTGYEETRNNCVEILEQVQKIRLFLDI